MFSLITRLEQYLPESSTMKYSPPHPVFTLSFLKESHYAQLTLKYRRFMLYLLFLRHQILAKSSHPRQSHSVAEVHPWGMARCPCFISLRALIYIKCTESCTGGLPISPIYLFYAVIYLYQYIDSFMFIFCFGL